MRAIWDGYITFGLVSIPVELVTAEKSNPIKFKMVDDRNNSPIHYERLNESGKTVPWSHIAKAYEYNKDKYVIMDEKELKEIAGENSHTINIVNFIETDKLDSIYFEKPYFLVPPSKGNKGYVILREILKKTHKIAIAKVIIHTREYLAAIIPKKNALVLNLIRYAEELKSLSEFNFPDENIKSYKISPKEMEMAKKLVESMSSKWDPKEYKDEYRSAVEKSIHEKIAHSTKHRSKMKSYNVTKPAKGGKVVDFMDLLKKSIKTKKSTKNKTVRVPPKTAARVRAKHLH